MGSLILSQTKRAFSTSDGTTNIADISFGALARAQRSMTGKRQHSVSGSSLSNMDDHNAESRERRLGKKDSRTYTRPSKHAPSELSSKHAVSRKRSVIDVPERGSRDPRFEPITGPLIPQKVDSNYRFLDGYREAELLSLKSAIKKSMPGDEKRIFALKKEVLRIESRKKAKERKEGEQEVIRRHRREERAKVIEGKKPYYLKKVDIKEQAMVDKFHRMNPGEIGKTLERRRRKKAQQDLKAMPEFRKQ